MRRTSIPGAFSNCRFEEIDALAISKYLGALNVGDRRRNNIRDAIVTLSLFAKKFGFLRGDLITEAERVPRVSLERDEPEIYTPEQLQIILDSVRSAGLIGSCSALSLEFGPKKWAFRISTGKSANGS